MSELFRTEGNLSRLPILGFDMSVKMIYTNRLTLFVGHKIIFSSLLTSMPASRYLVALSLLIFFGSVAFISNKTGSVITCDRCRIVLTYSFRACRSLVDHPIVPL